jgi:predicted RNA binding protein YcfA (HicA-like mRNA interferase family)
MRLHVKTGELIRRLEADGWYRVRQSGSHAIYRHGSKPGQLTVPVHPGKDVPQGTASKLLKTAGLQ